ncbi:MAG: AbrB family transcriptional regulator [Gemmatimonadetes bacterium]|jgi:antitoxin PrlF|nr:AbrB family transcriptional regulator [Gemmatimonadota bacterium]
MEAIKTSTLSAKGQTTVPAAIRRILDIKPGDSIRYDIKENAVRISKVEKIDLQWARALEKTLTEWEGEDDDDL